MKTLHSVIEEEKKEFSRRVNTSNLLNKLLYPGQSEIDPDKVEVFLTQAMHKAALATLNDIKHVVDQWKAETVEGSKELDKLAVFLRTQLKDLPSNK